MSKTLVKLSHPDRIVDEKSAATKQVVFDYYQSVIALLFPYLEDRILSVVRCPEGVGEECFFQKHVPKGLHQGVSAVEVDTNDGPEDFLALADPSGVAALVQYNAIEFHTWGSCVHTMEKPDYIVFDLDPDPGVEWEMLKDAALLVRNHLEELGLNTFLKSTGGKGLHLVCPIAPELEWDDVKELTRTFAEELAKRNPKTFVANVRKAVRKDRIYLDYLRNGRGATAIAPYSLRSRPGLPVAMPLSWNDLKSLRRPDAFDIESALKWIKKRTQDPWETWASRSVSLKRILKI